MKKDRLKLRTWRMGLSLISFLSVFNVCGTVSADCVGAPGKFNVIDQTDNISKAPVIFDNGMFDLNFPLYCDPVDIYLAVESPAGKLIFIDSTDNLTLNFLSYAARDTSAINTSFSVAGSPLASELAGECVMYWLIAPANGGDIIQSLNGPFELGFYRFQEDGFTQSPGMTFVRINPGTFMMGSQSDEADRRSNETLHQVTLSQAYYIQTTEVTQGQWKAVMGDNPSYYNGCGLDCPVEQVSWDNVQEFIAKLNQRREGAGMYKLPTEAQWEYAARAGKTTPFAFGECLSTDQANFDGDYPYEVCPAGETRATPVPVASFAPNAWGLYDMHGNVWEWCQDWYGEYPSATVTDPVGPSSGSYRVSRGGSWSRYARYCRSAIRNITASHCRCSDMGFRLILSPK